MPETTSQTCRSLLDLGKDRFAEWLTARGCPARHARQAWRWLFEGRATGFAEMTDLPLSLRSDLEAELELFTAAITTHQAAADGTHKLLLQLNDGQEIECVLIQEDKRRTACISTQVGCGMGCVFCASGLNGVVRNLTAGEILEQLLRLRNLLPKGDRLTHIVVMGMGEPLANLDALSAALDVACSKHGLSIGARHVTISTVGLPSRIRQLADLDRQFHLAVSLHAPNDALRSQIVPTNPKSGISEILAAADYFYQTTGRQVTFEYVLLRDVNDTYAHAVELASLLRRRQAHINLIPFNPVDGLPYRTPTQRSLAGFVACLREAGLSVKVRKRKGTEIDAACGQLRRRAGRVPMNETPASH